MTRIPFRALGRPLSGKNGRFNKCISIVPVVSEIPIGGNPDPAPDNIPDPAPDNSYPVHSTATEPDPEPVAGASIQWASTWTKAQLLAVAQPLGLSVTSANSKAEIIAALTAAG